MHVYPLPHCVGYVGVEYILELVLDVQAHIILWALSYRTLYYMLNLCRIKLERVLSCRTVTFTTISDMPGSLIVGPSPQTARVSWTESRVMSGWGPTINWLLLPAPGPSRTAFSLILEELDRWKIQDFSSWCMAFFVPPGGLAQDRSPWLMSWQEGWP